MARRIRWTPIALEDLTDVRSHIAADSPRHANMVARRIRDAVRALGEYPFSGHLAPEFESEQLRQVTVYSYRIIYRVQDGSIEVLGVVHGARDLRSLWERQGRPTGGDVPGT